MNGRKNIKLNISYDGTNYCGFQIQNNAETIEGVLTETAESVFKQDIKIIGCARTDSGVHAENYTANFFASTNMQEQNILIALNNKLPNDIVIKSVDFEKDDFHSRFCAKGKIYKYTIKNDRLLLPFDYPFAMLVKQKLDICAMKKAAKILKGKHNFLAFCASNSSTDNYICNIKSVKIKKRDKKVLIFVSGDRFLYNMVRIIVGTLVEIGLGKKDKNVVRKMLDSGKRDLGGKTAQAKGLCLYKVFY